MAIYHLRVDKIGRSKGQSAVASASYYADEPLIDHRTGIRHVMPPRPGLIHEDILTPAGMPYPHSADRQSLWNAVESHEKRNDSNTALVWHAALPRELTDRQAIILAEAFARSLMEREGNVIDLTVRQTGPGSLVAFLLCTTRHVTATGFGDKIDFVLGGRDREKRGLPKSPRTDLAEIRVQWADLVNAALENAGSTARVDHRSLKDRGYDLIPQTHLGSAARRRTERGEDIDRKAGSIERDVHNTRIIQERPSIIRQLIADAGQTFDGETIEIFVRCYVDDQILQRELCRLVFGEK
ncbi:MobA/MobL family protein [Allorhizobium ampelinum]|uniref:MobA/MobL family protein n=1 Tax=Allorhizobium ampelinum TaxID=3025782 RepID=UPI0002E7FE26|nr:MobA/MobL family protein [Allorhizobium ampelinum]